jgi:hypothetical protein
LHLSFLLLFLLIVSDSSRHVPCFYSPPHILSCFSSLHVSPSCPSLHFIPYHPNLMHSSPPCSSFPLPSLLLFSSCSLLFPTLFPCLPPSVRPTLFSLVSLPSLCFPACDSLPSTHPVWCSLYYSSFPTLPNNSLEISVTSSALARPQPIRQGNFREIKTSLRK